MSLGFLGGTLSAALSLTRMEKGLKIPDVHRSQWVLFARGVLGSAAAVPVYMLVQGKLISSPAAGHRDLLFFSFLAASVNAGS